MTGMEARMTASVARAAIDALGQRLPAATLTAAIRALRAATMALHGEIVPTCRAGKARTSPGALACSLGRRRVLAADAEAQLDALEKGLGARLRAERISGHRWKRNPPLVTGAFVFCER